MFVLVPEEEEHKCLIFLDIFDLSTCFLFLFSFLFLWSPEEPVEQSAQVQNRRVPNSFVTEALTIRKLPVKLLDEIPFTSP